MAFMHRNKHCTLLFVLILTNSLSIYGSDQIVSSFNRTIFPPDFLFGSGASSYQTEGSPLKHGGGASIWDEYTEKYPERIPDNSTGEVATDFYYKYKDDIQMAKEIGLDTFRLSISWSRVIPSGKIENGVNQIAVKYYNDVINEIVSKGIKPFVTLYHFDTPQALEEAYGGPLSSNFIEDFKDYADFCFNAYGDRVKLWTTINEPNAFSRYGYASTIAAPGRCSLVDGNCTSGDSATEPYLVGHQFLLAHATAANLYKTKYQATQKGEIGMNFASKWYYPLEDTSADRLAASRARDFDFKRILHPLIFGDYPESMKKLVGNRLPAFTEEQSKMLIRSQDYLTVNYYTSLYAYDVPSSNNNGNLSFNTDGQYGQTAYKNGVAIGEQTALTMYYNYPKGLRQLLLYIRDNYKNSPIYISENGYATNGSLDKEEAVNDKGRVSFIKCHLKYLLQAIEEGCNVKGYSIWALTDTWEWSGGFTTRFGLIHIDLRTLNRYMKASALWYKKFLLH